MAVKQKPNPTLAQRSRPAPPPPPADPVAAMMDQMKLKLSSDLRSKGRPTLADRVRREGAAAYGKRFARKKPKAKP